MKYSIVVLYEQGDEGLTELLGSLEKVFSTRKDPYEVIVVANGSSDSLKKSLPAQSTNGRRIKTLELSGKVPMTVRFRLGCEEAQGEIIVSCGSHQQITDESMEELLDSLQDGVDVACSWRDERQDSSFNKVQSKIFNAIVRRITKSQLHDVSSAIRVFRRQVIAETQLYGNMYRFFPILAARRGFKTREVKCKHYKWRGNTGPCGFSEYLERAIDVFTLHFITRFAQKPLRFFGLIGVILFLSGVAVSSFLFVQKALFGLPLGNRPVLLLAVFLMVMGIQAASTGLLGEIITFTHGRQKPQYTIEKII